MNVYGFKVLNQKGEEVSLDIYKGKVLLIVNTATKCGFTPQYEALEAMYEELHDKGFEILDFPCNQFLHQAPGSDEEINQFQESTKFFGDFLIEYIYDKNGKLISKELKKNPNFKEDMIDYPEGMI